METKISPSGREVTPQVRGGAERMMRFGLNRQVGESLLSSVDTSGDVEDFAELFIAEGERWKSRAEAAEADGRGVTARCWFRQAFYLYRIADFAFTENTSVKARAYEAALECFSRATRNLAPFPEAIVVEAFGKKFDGMLVIPTDGDAHPVCIFVYGSDGMKEEHYWQSALPLVERGIAVFIVDGPGQGSAVRGGIGAVADYENLVSACVDLVERDGRLLSHAVGIMGSSAGGYYAPRAFGREGRLRALLVNSALHTVLDGSWKKYSWARPQLRYNAQASTYDEAYEIYQDFTLTNLTNVDRDRPARIYHGSEDPRIASEQADRVGRFASDRSEVIIWPGGSHNLSNVAMEAHPQMWDWMAAELRRAAWGQ